MKNLIVCAAVAASAVLSGFCWEAPLYRVTGSLGTPPQIAEYVKTSSTNAEGTVLSLVNVKNGTESTITFAGGGAGGVTGQTVTNIVNGYERNVWNTNVASNCGIYMWYLESSLAAGNPSRLRWNADGAYPYKWYGQGTMGGTSLKFILGMESPGTFKPKVYVGPTEMDLPTFTGTIGNYDMSSMGFGLVKIWAVTNSPIVDVEAMRIELAEDYVTTKRLADVESSIKYSGISIAADPILLVKEHSFYTISTSGGVTGNKITLTVPSRVDRYRVFDSVIRFDNGYGESDITIELEDDTGNAITPDLFDSAATIIPRYKVAYITLTSPCTELLTKDDTWLITRNLVVE